MLGEEYTLWSDPPGLCVNSAVVFPNSLVIHVFVKYSSNIS